VILRDVRGVAFELETREEVDGFRRHGGHFEGAAVDLACALLRPGDVALDVGANIGAFTVAMARAVTASGRVFAFEPFAVARRRLQRTLELNATHNVEVLSAAVADRVGSATLVDYGAGYESWSTLAPREIETAAGMVRAAGHTEVGTTTLDAFAAARGLDRAAVAKIDVEGAEAFVIAGARDLLARRAIDVLFVEASDETLEAAGASVHGLLATLRADGLHVFELNGDGSVDPALPSGRVDRLMQLVAVTDAGRKRLVSAGRLS